MLIGGGDVDARMEKEVLRRVVLSIGRLLRLPIREAATALLRLFATEPTHHKSLNLLNNTVLEMA